MQLVDVNSNPSILLYATVLACVVVHWQWQKQPKRHKIRVLDTTLPILGNLLDRRNHADRPFDWFVEMSLRYDGEPWGFKMPGRDPIVMLTLPDAIEDVAVRQFDLFIKGEWQIDAIVDVFGAGVLASDGARWLHQRKIAAKFFSANVLRRIMMDTMRTNVDKVYTAIDEAMWTANECVDLKKLFHEFTLDTFVKVGMGVDLECIGAAEPHPFQHALDVVSPIMKRRLRLPTFMWKIERWLKVGPERELARQMKIVREWLNEIVQQSLRNAAERRVGSASTTVKSVVELFLEHGEEGVEGIQPADLIDFLLAFVVAARDTTADTMCWFFYLLGKHPQVEQNIRAEMKAKLSEEKDLEYLTDGHVRNLTYLEATIKETIRLYPAAPVTAKEAVKDTVIAGDIPIRKGQLVGISPYVTARHPHVWGADATEFKPERWIDPVTGALIQVPHTKFVSFSAGPRSCIGMGLAMLELRIITANLMNRYTFEVDRSNDGSYAVATTLVMKHPLRVEATRNHQYQYSVHRC